MPFIPTIPEWRSGSVNGCNPFLKWPGGKRWLASEIISYFGTLSRHVEPFCGAAACFFATAKSPSILADINRDLISTYLIVRDDCEKLIKRLNALTIDADTFYRIRASTPRTELSRAVRLIYLNKTAFNGLYRVNRQGRFNVPFGCKSTTRLCDSETLLECSRHLSETQVFCRSYQDTLTTCLPTDNIYIDPPYTTAHNCNGFRRYNESIFQWSDQVALASIANTLASSGYRVIVSNADHREIRALYRNDVFQTLRVTRPTNLAASPEHRGMTTELLFVSRKLLINSNNGGVHKSKRQNRCGNGK